MNRVFVLFFAIVLSISAVGLKVSAKEPEPSVSADSAVLIDAATGTILYSKNMNTAYPPASTTKVMTALLTLENTKLDDMVTVGKRVPYVDGSKIGLFDGEQLKVKDVLYGLMLLSGNDCAEALAEHIGGSLQEFAKLMTDRAKELGCENTNFVNPSGLYDENHRTSAKDLALIMREAAKHPEFREIASTFSYKIPPTNKHPEGINLANENKLINKNSKYYYPGAEVGKTGYTVQSLHSYVATASKNGQRLIVALVHDKSKNFYEDTKTLFNYGFNNFELMQPYKKGDTVTTFSEGELNVPLTAAEDYYYIKEKGSSEVPKINLIGTSLKDKSFKQGEEIMEASLTLKNKSLPNIKLASSIDHDAKSIFNTSIIDKNNQNKAAVYLPASLAALSIIAIVAFFVRYKNKRSR
jgi:D-alanyl-D-alanine carboxypeptidase